MDRLRKIPSNQNLSIKCFPEENQILKEQIKILQSTIKKLKSSPKNQNKSENLQENKMEVILTKDFHNNALTSSNQNSPCWRNDYNSNFKKKYSSNVQNGNSIIDNHNNQDDEDNGLIFSFNINQNKVNQTKNQTSEDFYDHNGKLHINQLTNNDNIVRNKSLNHQKSNKNISQNDKNVSKNRVMIRNNSNIAITKGKAVSVKVTGNAQTQRNKSPEQKPIIKQNKTLKKDNIKPKKNESQRMNSQKPKHEAQKLNINENSLPDPHKIIHNQEMIIQTLREEIKRVNEYTISLQIELEEERKINKKFKDFASDLLKFSQKQSIDSSEKTRRSKSSLYEPEKEF